MSEYGKDKGVSADCKAMEAEGEARGQDVHAKGTLTVSTVATQCSESIAYKYICLFTVYQTTDLFIFFLVCSVCAHAIHSPATWLHSPCYAGLSLVSCHITLPRCFGYP